MNLTDINKRRALEKETNKSLQQKKFGAGSLKEADDVSMAARLTLLLLSRLHHFRVQVLPCSVSPSNSETETHTIFFFFGEGETLILRERERERERSIRLWFLKKKKKKKRSKSKLFVWTVMKFFFFKEIVLRALYHHHDTNLISFWE